MAPKTTTQATSAGRPTKEAFCLWCEQNHDIGGPHPVRLPVGKNLQQAMAQKQAAAALANGAAAALDPGKSAPAAQAKASTAGASAPASGTAKSGKKPAESAPAPVSPDAGTDASGIPDTIEGLTADPATGGKSAYDVRQDELKAARERKGGKAKGRKGKAGAKTKGGKREAKPGSLTEANEQRKADLAAKREVKAQERALKAVPAAVGKMPAQVQAMFAAHYKEAGETGARRPKCDRNDFAAGWLFMLKKMNEAQKAAKAKAG